MSISNGYCTLAEFLAYMKESTGDAGDDAVIEDLIEASSRFIDRESGRTFYPRTETRYYDVPAGRELRLDDDLLSVTTLSNGDGTVIATSDYQLLPLNSSPKRWIRLKGTSLVNWETDSSGGGDGVISVLGSWGRSATTPDDIKEDCLVIARLTYNQRTGQTAEASARVTAAGVVIEAAGVPAKTMRNIRSYRRMT